MQNGPNGNGITYCRWVWVPLCLLPVDWVIWVDLAAEVRLGELRKSFISLLIPTDWLYFDVSQIFCFRFCLFLNSNKQSETQNVLTSSKIVFAFIVTSKYFFKLKITLTKAVYFLNFTKYRVEPHKHKLYIFLM